MWFITGGVIVKKLNTSSQRAIGAKRQYSPTCASVEIAYVVAVLSDNDFCPLIKRELLDTVRARKTAYYGHTMRK